MGAVLSPAIFNRQLRQMGQAVQWRRATLCPCRSPISGAARQGCPVCDSRGTVWAAPIPAWTGVASQRVAREWAAFGQWESGDEVLTIPGDSPLYGAGENDRILMTQSSEPFQQAYTRDGRDRLPTPQARLDQVTWLSADGTIMIYGSLPAVDLAGVPSWTVAATAPPAGVQYSVRGRRLPEYYLFKDFPSDRSHFGGLPLPRRVVARKFDLYGR